MKALILNGAAGEDPVLTPVQTLVAEKLRSSGWDVTFVALREQKIADCLGCFGCWLKTPGVCVIDDDGRRVAEAIARSDLLVLLTRVTFGGYSSELKKALDRTIPNIMPYFRMIRGEIHHSPRYARYPDLVTVGVAGVKSEDARRIFTRLCERNAINFHSRRYASGVVGAGDGPGDMDLTLAGLLKKVEAIA